MLQAYKILAKQEGISNNEAKALIDAGVVSAKGEKIVIARALMSEKTEFKLMRIEKPKIIYEDDDIIALNKPAFAVSEKIAENLAKNDKNITLLNRLDKETSGVLMLAKNEEFRAKAVSAFKARRVKKTYYAILVGILAEDLDIDLPLSTIKTKSGAFSKIDLKNGKTAITHAQPILCEGKKTLAKIEIETGRTHQIRVHLAHAGYGVYGDSKYAKSTAKRVFLHSYETEILGLKFRAALTKDFGTIFELPSELTR
nr:RluA family pseudouridine synthase [uncultured Campylobacter sp.]